MRNLLVAVALFSTVAQSGDQAAVFGPQKFLAQGKPHKVSFAANSGSGELLLVIGKDDDPIQNCKGPVFKNIKCHLKNLKAKAKEFLYEPANIKISLNSKRIFERHGHHNGHHNPSEILIPIQLLSSNKLEVEVHGLPTSFIEISIKGADQPPSAQLIAQSPTSGLAPLMVLFDAGRSEDPEGQALSYTWSFGDGSPTQIAGPQIAHEFQSPGEYIVTVTVKDPSGGQTQASLQVSANAPVLPPNPELLAPVLSLRELTDFSDQVSFLYSGPNPIQTNVAPGAIKPERVAVLRGQVLDGDGQPLAGVKVRALNHPEFGQTLSRADGRFDLAVNTGTTFTVDFNRNGYLPAQRKVNTKISDYYSVEAVHLVRIDPVVTPISLNSSAVEVARGSTSVDQDGERTATVLFPPSVTAVMRLPDGSSRSIDQMNVRLTEFTVGENGPDRMPAALPDHTDYTYAVGLTADEGIALGAARIDFSKPVSFYVDNFLNVPVGVAVPVGYYNPVSGYWEPRNDGIVIRILSIENGQAVVDVGSGGPATADDLNHFGIDSAELAKLAELYEPGKALWRARLSHFSTADLNWVGSNEAPELLADGDPENDDPKPPPEDKKECANGCVIDVQRRVFTESIDLPGTPYSLVYSTEKSGFRQASSRLRFPLLTQSMQNLVGIEVEVDVGGRNFSQSFTPSPGLNYEFDWDGKDAYGRNVQGPLVAKVKVSYLFDDRYIWAPYDRTRPQTFDTFNPNIVFSTDPTRNLLAVIKSYDLPLRPPFDTATQLALDEVGRWTFDVHHFFDPRSQRIYFGNGKTFTGNLLPKTVQTIAGTGVPGIAGNGGPAIDAQVSGNGGIRLAWGNEGQIILAEANNHRIRIIDNEGNINSFAGTGQPGFSGDGGDAKLAQLNSPRGMTMDPEGNVYVCDFNNHRIRKIDRNGIISTFAGTGVPGYSGDGGPASQAQINGPQLVLFGRDGSLYFSEGGNHVIRRVTADGNIHTIAGTGQPGYSGDGGPALEATFSTPNYVAFDNNGAMLVVDIGNCVIRKINPAGIVSTIAGNGVCGNSGDGGPALEAQIQPGHLAIDGANFIYVTDRENHRIRVIDNTGKIDNLIGTGLAGYNGEGLSGTQAQINFPAWILTRPDGSLVFSESGGHRIREFTNKFGDEDGSNFRVTGPNGDEIYIFDAKGKHLRTLRAKTGAIKYSFEYDSIGLLSAIVDGDSNRTEIQRDGSGRPLNVITPYGQNYTIALDSAGGLSQLRMPTGEAYTMSYTAEGLLKDYIKPKGNSNSYEYDGAGNLIKESNSGGTVQTFTSLPLRTIQHQTNGGRNQFIQFNEDGHGITNYTSIAGDVTISHIDSPSDFGQSRYPDGVTEFRWNSRDTRLKGLNSFRSNESERFPSGGERTITRSRSFEVNSLFDFIQTDVVTDSGISQVTTVYESATQTYTTTTRQGETRLLKTDAQERPVVTQIGNDLPVQLFYDERGRLSRISQGARLTQLFYDQNGFLAKTVDPLGQERIFINDASGRVKSVTNFNNETTFYDHDANGNISSITPPNQALHTLFSNAFELLATYITPEQNQMQNFYDADRLLTRVDRADQKSIQYIYEPSGGRRLRQVNYGSNSVLIQYQPKTDNVQSRTTPNANISYTYDGYLPLSKSYSGPFNASFNQTYMPTMQPSLINIGPFSAQSFYDFDIRLSRIGNLVFTRDVPSGRIIRASIGNTQENWGYNVFGELNQRQFLLNGAAIFQDLYARDNLGRISSIQRQTNFGLENLEYTYDPAGHLIKVSDGGQITAQYSYDGNGNRLSVTRGSTTITATYDSEDKLLTYGQYRYTYNAHGDLQTKFNTQTNELTRYTYDELGQLRRVELPDGRVIDYVIDGENKRIAKYINSSLFRGYVYDHQGRLTGELDSSGQVIALYIYGSESHSPEFMVRSTGTLRFVKDQLGSIRMVVGAGTGSMPQSIKYDEFGRVLQNTNPNFQPFGFAGGIYDPDTGLVRFGARDYDAEIGRWTTKDPIMFDGGDGNLYGYVGGDPVNIIDPSGKRALSIIRIILTTYLRWCLQNLPVCLAQKEPPPNPAPDSKHPPTCNAEYQSCPKEKSPDSERCK